MGKLGQQGSAATGEGISTPRKTISHGGIFSPRVKKAMKNIYPAVVVASAATKTSLPLIPFGLVYPLGALSIIGANLVTDSFAGGLSAALFLDEVTGHKTTLGL